MYGRGQLMTLNLSSFVVGFKGAVHSRPQDRPNCLQYEAGAKVPSDAVVPHRTWRAVVRYGTSTMIHAPLVSEYIRSWGSSKET